MAQSSGPITGINFSDTLWRDLFGDEPGVVGDMDGSSYKLTLPTNSDFAQVGSTTQASVARLAGFGHRINAGSTEAIEIPAASGSSRTDIIALRYDPANAASSPLGPVRVTRLAGTSAALPVYDSSPPGVEDLPLWAVTRAPGQALSQATVQRLFTRLAPVLDVPTGAPLPTSAPLGSIVNQGYSTSYRRELDVNGVPAWFRWPLISPVNLSPSDPDWVVDTSVRPTAREMPWGEVKLGGIFRRTVITPGASAGPNTAYAITAPLPVSLRPGGSVNRLIGVAPSRSGPVDIYYLASTGSIGYQFLVDTPVYREAGWYISLEGLSYIK